MFEILNRNILENIMLNRNTMIPVVQKQQKNKSTEEN